MNQNTEAILRDIKDAARCKHGKIDRHRTAQRGYQWVDENGVSEAEWCEGATELRLLLDSLTNVYGPFVKEWPGMA